ncbi:fimbria/pilus outer membrane usher protein [Klebsiella pneumoniae subsp. pneumoniae]|nr:fimbria/pilus outer membrane usher protein [Klebsiella pneumoniae subsp. pneumoniae]
MTFGPYASDTFALIHADGAQGAVVQNGSGAVIDRLGMPFCPSLSPYRRKQRLTRYPADAQRCWS